MLLIIFDYVELSKQRLRREIFRIIMLFASDEDFG